MSGKEEGYQWDKAKVSDALTEEQKEILEKRGVLSPAEIHKLASKTKTAVGGTESKAACHSDETDAEKAKRLQDELLPVINK